MSSCLIKYKALVVFLILAGLSACNKPTYPTGKIEESVLKLCKDEYKLDNVKIKILGSTLGVYIPVEGLIDPDLKLNENDIRGYGKFTNKVWNATRFVLEQTKDLDINNLPILDEEDKKIRKQQITDTT